MLVRQCEVLLSAKMQFAQNSYAQNLGYMLIPLSPVAQLADNTYLTLFSAATLSSAAIRLRWLPSWGRFSPATKNAERPPL